MIINEIKLMSKDQSKQRIAILGGGPSGLFMYKRLIESGKRNLEISIFERKSYLGSGMPYSTDGANEEHITNVSDNEIPIIFSSIEDWIKIAPKEVLDRFKINSKNFNEYKVLPRLFFGEYLSAQFELLQKEAEKADVLTNIHLSTAIVNLHYKSEKETVTVEIEDGKTIIFDRVIICTGHNWPKKFENKIPDYFDSPYPPKKLAHLFNHTIGLKGASLTAIDAVRTLARNNGEFTEDEDGKWTFKVNENSPDFKLVMHSRNGLLPAVRFHLEDSHLGKDTIISKEDLDKNIAENGGFLSLDFVFERNFKDMFKKDHSDFYKQIEHLNIEQFVGAMMDKRERVDPFELFKKEYQEAERSIKNKESIYWKEVLAILSFAMNYPAKYLSAEDMQRLQKVLMPLISIVIAFVPQSSCRDLMALHDAGILSIVSVGEDSHVEPVETGGADYHYEDEDGNPLIIHFDTFIDCVGQPHLSFNDFPFEGLIEENVISPAKLKFQSAINGKTEIEKGNELVKKDNNNNYSLQVPGITINDSFQVVDAEGEANKHIYIMAVPYIGGFNPDYSGIDFCEAASKKVVESIFS
jgi:hypothetical protein